jgi:hypothetical protein
LPELASRVAAIGRNVLVLPQRGATAAEAEQPSLEKLPAWQHKLLDPAGSGCCNSAPTFCHTGKWAGAQAGGTVAAALLLQPALNQEQQHLQQLGPCKQQQQQQFSSTAARECTLQDQMLLDQLLLESGLLQGTSHSTTHSHESFLASQVPGSSATRLGLCSEAGCGGSTADTAATGADRLLAELLNDVGLVGQHLQGSTALLASSAGTPSAPCWSDCARGGLAGHQDLQRQLLEQQKRQQQQQQQWLEDQQQQQQWLEYMCM